MSYLLDTCMISELTKREPEENVLRWIEGVDESFLYISVLTLGEIRKGIVKLPDLAKKTALKEWLQNDVRQRFEGRIISISIDIAEIWGKIQGTAEQKGNKLPAIDSLIAATAIANGLKVVTRNTTDIERAGAMTYNPWEP